MEVSITVVAGSKMEIAFSNCEGIPRLRNVLAGELPGRFTNDIGEANTMLSFFFVISLHSPQSTVRQNNSILYVVMAAISP